MSNVPEGTLERRLGELSTLNAIGEVLNREADFERALSEALTKLVELLGLGAGWVFLSRVSQGDHHHGGFSLAAWTGLPPALARDGNAPLCSGGCDCQWLFRGGRLDAGVNIVHCSRLEAAEGDKAGLEVHASIPLLGRAGPVGILNLAAPGEKRFGAQTLAFLTAVGRQLGTAFERAALLRAREAAARYLAALEERQRLARDMHDSVSQLLFAADLALQVAREAPEGEAKARGLESASALVTSALGELRALVETLRPADLSGGLAAALERLGGRALGLRVHVEVGSRELAELPEAHAEALYRVAQEAVHNVLKHARASNLWLRLEPLPAGVRLTVEDDGVGLADGLSEGLGLPSMRARVAQLGGVLTFAPRTPHGLRVTAELPWMGA